MKLSVVIPAHNEQDCIARVVAELVQTLSRHSIRYEIIIVNDNSTDDTLRIIEGLSQQNTSIVALNSRPPKGFGRVISKGLENVTGDMVVIFMADGSDDAEDVVRYYATIQQGYDCAFGSRFAKGSKVNGYPLIKLLLNRCGNKLIQLLFLTAYNDVSNAFKAYRTEVIKAIQPLVSQYFNITVEMPLKAIIRGFSYAVVPINWYGRQSGVSKYRIRELSRKYFFSILYVWLEKMLLKEEIGKGTKEK